MGLVPGGEKEVVLERHGRKVEMGRAVASAAGGIFYASRAVLGCAWMSSAWFVFPGKVVCVFAEWSVADFR